MSDVSPPIDMDQPFRFELTSAFDDEIDPTTVTIYPRDREDIVTSWISIDIGYAIDLYDAA